MEHRTFRIFANGETADIPRGLHGGLLKALPSPASPNGEIRYLLMIDSIADKQSDEPRS